MSFRDRVAQWFGRRPAVTLTKTELSDVDAGYALRAARFTDGAVVTRPGPASQTIEIVFVGRQHTQAAEQSLAVVAWHEPADAAEAAALAGTTQREFQQEWTAVQGNPFADIPRPQNQEVLVWGAAHIPTAAQARKDRDQAVARSRHRVP